MRTFSHPKEYVILARRLRAEDFNEVPLGTVFNIVEIGNCTGKAAKGHSRCINGGPADCPGRVKLDKPPFDKEGRCYSWGGKSIFDYFVELK